MAFLDFTYKHLQVIRNTVGTLVLIVIFYILQYIFNMHFLCSCKPGLHPNGVLYMALPPLILAFIVMIVEPFHQRRIFYRCDSFSRCCSCFCSYISKLFFKWVGLAAVWIAAVLFDGDWYVCLKTNFNKNQTGIPCKQNLTYEEHRIIGDYMTQSLEYGMGLICIFLFVWSTFEIRRLSCRLCCRSSCHQSSDDNLTYHSCCSKSLILRPYYRVVFKDLLAEEVSNCLNDNLKKIATRKANAICKPFLQAIENHETQGNNRDKDNNGDITPSYAWETISVPGFYFGEDVSQALPDDTSEICFREV